MKIRRDLRIALESKVSVDAGLEGLKVISCWEDGRRKRVPVIGISELANAFVRLVSNLSVKGC